MSWRDGFKKFADKLKEIKDQAMANLQLPSFHASKIGREIEIEGKELEETLKTCENHMGYLLLTFSSDEADVKYQAIVLAVNKWTVGCITYDQAKVILSLLSSHPTVQLTVCNIEEIVEPYVVPEQTNSNIVIQKCLQFLHNNYLFDILNLNYKEISSSLLYSIVKWTSIEPTIDYTYLFLNHPEIIWKLLHFTIGQRFPISDLSMKSIKTDPELSIDYKEFATNLKYPSTLFHICDIYKLYSHLLKQEDLEKYIHYFMSLMKINDIVIFDCIMSNKDNIYTALYDKYNQIDLIIEIIKYLKTQNITEEMLESISEYDVSEMEDMIDNLTSNKPKTKQSKQQLEGIEKNELEGEGGDVIDSKDKEEEIEENDNREEEEEEEQSLLSKIESLETSKILQIINVLFTRNHEYIMPTYILLFIADINNSDVNLVEKYFFIKDIVHMVPKKCQIILAHLIDLCLHCDVSIQLLDILSSSLAFKEIHIGIIGVYLKLLLVNPQYFFTPISDHKCRGDKTVSKTRCSCHFSLKMSWEEINNLAKQPYSEEGRIPSCRFCGNWILE